MRRLALGLVLLAACGTAQAAPAGGVDATLALTDYRGTPLVCGSAVTIDTWLAGKLTASATEPGTASFRVNTYYGDTGENLPKFDRIGWTDVEVRGGTRVVGVAYWWPQPDDRGEPYDWRFVLEVNGTPTFDCTVTVTRT